MCIRDSKSLAKIKPPPQLKPADECQRLLGRLTETQESAGRLRASAKVTKQLRSMPELQATDRLQRLTGRIGEGERRLKSIRAASQMLTKLRIIDSLQDTAPLNSVLGKLRTFIDAQQQAVTAASKAQDNLQECAESIETFVLANPTCTVCGGDVDAATLMSSASGSHTHAHLPTPKSIKRRRQHESN